MLSMFHPPPVCIVCSLTPLRLLGCLAGVVEQTVVGCAAQDNILNSIACHALARMAYIAPDLVLPIMHERFEVGTISPFCTIGFWHVVGVGSVAVSPCGFAPDGNKFQMFATQ